MSNSTSRDFCLFFSAVIRECAFAVNFFFLFHLVYFEFVFPKQTDIYW